MNLEYILYQFLLKYNKVEVPSFGVFELAKESAKIDSENSIITPPKEIIVFSYNPNVISNQLVQDIAVEYNEEQNAVTGFLKTEIQKWMQTLNTKQILDLGNLGHFQLDDNGKVVKIEDHSQDVFGFEDININNLKNWRSKKLINTENYAFDKNVIWAFLAILVVGVGVFTFYGNPELLFGKTSKIPTKKLEEKNIKKTVIVPKQDSIKQDSIKTSKNAETKKTN